MRGFASRAIRRPGFLSIFGAVAVLFLFLAPSAGAQEVIHIRTGQVSGAPGTCPGADDCFRYLVAPQCQMPLSNAPFTSANFAAASAGPPAVVLTAHPVWTAVLPSDPQARWINWQQASACQGGTPRSVLYACRFIVNTPCNPTATINACWLVDDVLGDPAGSGPNPIGVYINGIPLNPGFSGGNYATETCLQQAGIPLVTGVNTIYIYQRDLGCGLSGVNFSATLTVTSAMAPHIGVTKFYDTNGNGVQDGGEPGLPGWTINVSGPITTSGVTGAGGVIVFGPLPPGSYQITEVSQPGWIQTAPSGGINYLTIDCGQDYVCSFGNRRCDVNSCFSPPACLSAWFPFDECAGTLANEVAANRDGTVIHGGTPTWAGGSPGSSCSMGFPAAPGGTIQVSCPDYPEHDFGTGSFTVFAWVRTNLNDNNIHTVVDKRQTPFLTPTGYALYIYGGIFRFQVGDGSGSPTTYVSTAPPLGDGQWHSVAVSVCRNPNNPATNKVMLAVDSHFDTFTAGIPTGNLSNTAGLTIGDQCPGFITGIPFSGLIDEVQLYKCCLNDAQLSAMHGQGGFCPEACYLPSVVNSFFSSAVTTLKVCNYSTSPQTYNWTIAPLPAGPGCSVAGPTAYSPMSGTVTLPPAIGGPSCVNIPITVVFPPGMTFGQTACYQVTVQNTATGRCFGCRGRVRKMFIWHGNPVIKELALAPGQVAPGGFVIRNSGDAPLSLEYRLSDRSSDEDPNNLVVRLNGLPPGEPVIGTLSLAPHDSSTITFTAELAEFQPLNVNEVILEADLDGDGVPEPLSSLALISATDQTSDAPAPPVPALPPGFSSLQASPNPFLEATGISLALGSSTARVRVEVFDVGGRLVRALFLGRLEAGNHRFSWDGKDDSGSQLGAGLYFIRAQGPGLSAMTKVVRLE